MFCSSKKQVIFVPLVNTFRRNTNQIKSEISQAYLSNWSLIFQQMLNFSTSGKHLKNFAREKLELFLMDD